MTRTASLECHWSREATHRRLDGDGLDPSAEQRLARHLADCAACREAARELEDVQRALSGLAPPRMPDELLERVLARTSRAPELASRRRWIDWRVAASLGALGLLGLWYVLGRPVPLRGASSDRATGIATTLAPAEPTTISRDELERAAAEARLVLGLTARTLERAERAALARVIGGEVAPALERIPVDWPDRHQPTNKPAENKS